MFPGLVTLDATPGGHHVFSGHSIGRNSVASDSGSSVFTPGGQKWPMGHGALGKLKPGSEQTIPTAQMFGSRNPGDGQ